MNREEALDFLMKNKKEICVSVRKRLRSSDWEDVFSETYLEIFENVQASYSEDDINRIVSKHLQRIIRQGKRSVDLSDEHVGEIDPIPHVEAREELAFVLSLIDSLSLEDEKFKALKLHVIDNKKYKEISAEMGTSLMATDRRINRARTFLKKELENV